ncbi:MAG: NAD-dependent succinate-semialdehyde dehydrogenase [Candidatus Promineifilaceae bacterium]|nr:NAD-dependent succinate-semialdehyde dehydrogenase [Candidatus Promineifilaceae bacterium]
MPIAAVNPASGKTIRTYEEMLPGEVAEISANVAAAYPAWRERSFAERAEVMRRAASILRERAEEYGRLMAEEMGKPVRDGQAEAEKCAWVCDYYADNAERFLRRKQVDTDASKSFVTYQPLGVVLAVMPWNFPFWQVFRFAAPNLMAGNVGLLKHASNVPGCALAIEDIFRQAGFPDNVFRTLLVGSRQVDAIIKNPLVRAVTLTGSTPAGRAVAAKAGEQLKKTVLELGGSDPYIILDDADLALAVDVCVSSRLINSGQSCIAAKRFIVTDKNRDDFEKRYVEKMRSFKMGDPLDPETQVGPQARIDLRDELHHQVEQSIAQGARLLLGGEIPDRPGAYYPPTVLADVAPGMPAYDEEMFGPVAAIIPVSSEAEAVRVANDSPFGLGAAVFTEDLEKGEQIAAEALEAGCCFVNSFVKSDPRLPFGGIKESGYGRELGEVGIKEFVNIKTVWIR